MPENATPKGKDGVRAEVMEGIALLTFNTPPRNVATADCWDRLADILGQLADDPAVRVLVLTGAGHFAFVTDPDAAAMEDIALHDAAALRAQQALAAFPKPAIARIRGDCIGAGLLLALHADLLVAAEDSAFSLPAARWGAAYPASSVAALVRLVGPQHAKRMLFTGGRIEAREALRIGLATLVVADAGLSDAVVELARDISDNAPLALSAAKRAVNTPDDPALGSIAEECRNSRDHEIGLAALRNGRRPVFEGR